jgi:uncharacterized UBP type Zn finger protein
MSEQAERCTHIDELAIVDGVLGAPPSGDGCVECLERGMQWVHLRRCLTCGHVGCCDNSVGKHATAHSRTVGHPLVQSFEPDEDWVWCYPDDVGFRVPGAEDSPSHP